MSAREPYPPATTTTTAIVTITTAATKVRTRQKSFDKNPSPARRSSSLPQKD
ncbi:hypothetical protein PT974_12085 [Cladobotryum mycophilum]|uniref:Uncharacterized protein n=1 Tax=Cladobotryum mycophilum TaxID=491253 RepID=A0ABR0S7K6_9HYPO